MRHAEKDSGSNPGLTEQGAARAQALAVRMDDVVLDAIYATEFRRTQETVQPTADAKDMEVLVDIEPKEELPALILDSHVGDTILHAGHSFTIPSFMENIGADEAPALSGYGQLWILSIQDGEVIEVDLETFSAPDE